MADNDAGGGDRAIDARGLFEEAGWAMGAQGQGGEAMGRLEGLIEGLARDMGEVEVELRELESSIEGLIERMLGSDSIEEIRASRKQIAARRERKAEREGVLRDMQGAAEAYDRRVAAEAGQKQRAEAAERIATLNKAVGESLKKMRKEQEKMER